MTGLKDVWLARLEPDEHALINARGEPLGELAEALTPPPATFEVEEESFVERAEDDLLVELLLRLHFPGVSEYGAVTLSLDTASAAALLDGVSIPRVMQRNAYGRRIVRRVADIAIELGLRTLDLRAEVIGRYSWALCGFDFYDEEERDRVVAAAEEFAARLGHGLDLEWVQHPWEIAALEGATTRATMAAARSELVEGDPNEQVELGRALLLGPDGNDWSGRLDLPESEGYDLLRHYTHGHE